MFSRFNVILFHPKLNQKENGTNEIVFTNVGILNLIMQLNSNKDNSYVA